MPSTPTLSTAAITAASKSTEEDRQPLLTKTKAFFQQATSSQKAKPNQEMKHTEALSYI
ncbi:hypothetical protein BCR33DRAFT_712435, partial [Rhizoclosmatium globosum]